MATQKELFVNDYINTARTFATEVMDKLADLNQTMVQNGYDSGGSDPIVDADLANFNGLTAAQVNSLLTAFQQLDNYANNTAVVTANYSATYNAVRNAQLG